MVQNLERKKVSSGLLPTSVSSLWEAWSTAVHVQRAFGESRKARVKGRGINTQRRGVRKMGAWSWINYLCHLACKSWREHWSARMIIVGYSNTITTKNSTALSLVVDASEVSECHWLLEDRATWQWWKQHPASSFSDNCILGAINTPNYMFVGHASMTRYLSQATRRSLPGVWMASHKNRGFCLLLVS